MKSPRRFLGSAYYVVNTIFSVRSHNRPMKTVISVRLSDERLRQLDETCKRLNMNRSEVIDAALRVLPELISDTAELKYDPSKLQRKTAEQ